MKIPILTPPLDMPLSETAIKNLGPRVELATFLLSGVSFLTERTTVEFDLNTPINRSTGLFELGREPKVVISAKIASVSADVAAAPGGKALIGKMLWVANSTDTSSSFQLDGTFAQSSIYFEGAKQRMKMWLYPPLAPRMAGQPFGFQPPYAPLGPFPSPAVPLQVYFSKPVPIVPVYRYVFDEPGHKLVIFTPEDKPSLDIHGMTLTKDPGFVAKRPCGTLTDTVVMLKRIES